jgi:AhpD family alkylhydroperoxidase
MGMTEEAWPGKFESRLDFEADAPRLTAALFHLDNAAAKELDKAGIDERLRELVRLRVSQINRCAYCIDMHSKDARAHGESDQRLGALPAWRDTPFFDDRERAALGFAEAMATLSEQPVSDQDFAAASAELSSTELAAIGGLVVAIQAWNTVSVSFKTWVPGSYEP